MKKAIFLLILPTIAALVLSACGDRAAVNFSMYDLSRAMLDAAEFDEMSYVSSSDNAPEDLFANVSTLPYSKVDSFFIAYASDGKGNADEIVVIAVKEQGDLSAAVDSLKSHLANRKSIYATYDPTQSEKLEHGLVLSQDGLAVLIVSPDNDAVCKALTAFLRNAGES